MATKNPTAMIAPTNAQLTFETRMIQLGTSVVDAAVAMKHPLSWQSAEHRTLRRHPGVIDRAGGATLAAPNQPEQMPNSDTSLHLASVIHVTDTHLFLDGDGQARSPRDRSALVRALARLGVDDLDAATGEDIERWANAMRAAVARERALPGDHPVVVAHSGDIEAFGGPNYDGVALLATHFDALDIEGSVVVFGNHDVWPGTVPFFGLNGRNLDTQKRRLATKNVVSSLQPPSAPIRFELPGSRDSDEPRHLALVPLSSVHSGIVRGGILAAGALTPHPPDGDDPHLALTELNLSPRDINVAVMHHPVHLPRPETWKDWARVGQMGRREAVAGLLSAVGIDLLLCGHRHRLDPPFGERADADEQTQPPLRRGTAQLVATSPTLPSPGTPPRPGTPTRGLCVYRLLEYPDGSLGIDRLIHRTDPGRQDDQVLFEANVVRLPTFQPPVVSS